MCQKEYEMRAQKHNVYHMGLVTRQGAEKSLKNVGAKKFVQHYPMPPKQVLNPFLIDVKLTQNSIYLAGKIHLHYSLYFPNFT